MASWKEMLTNRTVGLLGQVDLPTPVCIEVRRLGEEICVSLKRRVKSGVLAKVLFFDPLILESYVDLDLLINTEITVALKTLVGR